MDTENLKVKLFEYLYDSTYKDLIFYRKIYAPLINSIEEIEKDIKNMLEDRNFQKKQKDLKALSYYIYITSRTNK